MHDLTRKITNTICLFFDKIPRMPQGMRFVAKYVQSSTLHAPKHSSKNSFEPSKPRETKTSGWCTNASHRPISGSDILSTVNLFGFLYLYHTQFH